MRRMLVMSGQEGKGVGLYVAHIVQNMLETMQEEPALSTDTLG